MSSAFTLAQLKTAIKNHIEDQGTDFDANVETLIKTAEDNVLRDLDLEIFKATAAAAFAQGNQAVTKPAGYLACDTFFYTIANVRTQLEPRTYDYLIDYAPNASTEGLPKYYAELNTTQVIVGPAPNAAVAAAGGTMRYLKRPNSVVVDVAGSWLSLNVGDLLLHACLVAADKFNVADERLAMWRGEYDRLLGSARHDFRHLLSRSYNPIAAQPKAQGAR